MTREDENRGAAESIPAEQSAQQGFTGTVSIELTDLIQMLCLSRSDLIIRVKSGSGNGIIYVREGQIHHAQTETSQGETAFFEIVGWKDGHFEMLPFKESGVNSVKKAWEHLLMEAMRIKDENKARDGADISEVGVQPPAGPSTAEFDDRIDSMFDELEEIAQSVMEEEEGREVVESPESIDSLDSLGSLDSLESLQSLESVAPVEPLGAKPVRVLVVDDSPFFGNRLKKTLEEEPGIEVVGIAKNGKECLDLLSTGAEVDLITLDIQMPVMPGDTALKHIMIRHPIPVLILSSIQPESLGKVFDFLQLGAVDFISKPEAKEDPDRYGKKLRSLVRRSARGKVSHFKRWRKVVRDERADSTTIAETAPKLLVALGSEGAYINWFRLPLSALSRRGIVIGLQQLPESFLPGFCQLIQVGTGANASPLVDAARLTPGMFYFGNANRPVSLKLSRDSMTLEVEYASSEILEWRDGIEQWLDQLSREAGSLLSVYFLSSAHSLPNDLVERLLQNGSRLLLSPDNAVICTDLVDGIEIYSSGYPEQVIPGVPPESLTEVW